KLINQILRFNHVDRRMPRTFDALVAQIKRDHRGPMGLVRDQKYFLAQFCFEVVANSLHFRGHRFPTTPTVARIASEQMETGAANQIGIERKETHQESSNNRCSGEDSHAAFLHSFAPVMDREQTK